MSLSNFDEQQSSAGHDFEPSISSGHSSTKVVGFTSTGLFVVLVFIIPSYTSVFLLFALVVFVLTRVLEKGAPDQLENNKSLDGNIIAGGIDDSAGAGDFFRAASKVFTVILVGIGLFTLLAFGSCMMMF